MDDLNKARPGIIGLNERDDDPVGQDPINETRQDLDEANKELLNALERKDAMILCLHFLISSLDPTPSRSKLTNIHGASLTLPNRPDMSSERDVINARLADARSDFTDKILAASIKSISRVVQDRSHMFPVEDLPFFYRVISPTSYTFFGHDIGFCASRWLRERKFEELSPKEEVEAFHKHMKRKHFHSPYISLTDRPSRALQFGDSRFWNGHELSAKEVCIIDANRLCDAKVRTEQTTAVAIRLGIPEPKYTTDSHWLAWYCVPSCCIVKRVSFEKFEKVCEKNGICGGSDKILGLEAFEDDSLDEDGLPNIGALSVQDN